MQFKRLRLSGFKSFVDPTELFVEPGLSGIVGPNGCGKSNLLEALRWVMGENSAKSMRGEQMDDVIFSGTERRPARNLAEVTVLLDNTGRKAPAQFNDSDELEVSRRIERESGSAFRINGQEVRARDVQLLFADAATGAHSPALVSQGKVSSFINAKPQERRLILEEAAGISGLYSRRKEAETRLRAAESNLLRLEDIMIQMEEQAASLKRQAKQATRYKNIAGDIRRVRAVLLHQKWCAMDEMLTAARQALDTAEQEVAAQTAIVTKLNTESEKLHTGLAPLRQKEAEASAALSRVRIEHESLEAEERNIQNRVEELKGRLEQLAQDLAREKTFLQDSEETLQRQNQEKKTLAQELAAQAGNAQDIEAAFRDTLEKTQAVEQDFNEINSAVTARNIRADHLRQELETLNARVERLVRERESAKEELAGLKGMTDAAQKIDHSAIDKSLDALKNIEGKLAATEVKRLEAQQAFEAAREQASAQKARALALISEIEALESLLANDGNAPDKPVSSSLSVTPGMERALSAALGDDLDAPVGKDGEFAWRSLNPLKNAPALPKGATPLSEYVTGSKALVRRLSQVGVVKDGEALMEDLSAGQRLVSRDGTLWRWDGLVRTSKAPTQAALRIQQKNKLVSLRKEHLSQDEKTKKLVHDAEALEAKFIAAKDAETALRTDYGAANETYRVERDKLSGQESESLKSAERSAALTEAVGRMESDLAETREKIISLETELKTNEADSKQEIKLETARTLMEDWRDKLGEAKARFESWSRIAGEKESRIKALEHENAAWAERAKASMTQISELKERESQTQTALKALDQSPARFEERRIKLLDILKEAEEKANTIRDELAMAETKGQEKDKELKAGEAMLSGIRENMVMNRSRHESSTERKGELEEQISEEFGCGIDALFDEVDLKPKQRESLMSVEDAEIKLERLKAERERLGAVNLRADVELEDLSKQISHLTAEREDLEAAIRRLRHSIGTLNREGRQKLLEAFETVNKNFGELFAKIFNGGHAHLVLTESDDPLEAGLDIMASPPGKKLLHRSLLSGGEQALTAITLIFAVFLTNPAPLCVLDEVDAPLDDANVERFCDLLDEIKDRTRTRFMIVTHNAITMARMERLYGVTMGEQGVSQLVSVALEEVQEMKAFG